jgi:hypothetical protein
VLIAIYFSTCESVRPDAQVTGAAFPSSGAHAGLENQATVDQAILNRHAPSRAFGCGKNG